MLSWPGHKGQLPIIFSLLPTGIFAIRFRADKVILMAACKELALDPDGWIHPQHSMQERVVSFQVSSHLFASCDRLQEA